MRETVSSAAATDNTSDDLDDEVDCRDCHGARYVRRNVALDHPDFGRAVPCRCVARESADERRERLLRYSNLGSLTRLRFENLVAGGRSSAGQDQEVFDRCVVAAKAFAAEPAGWLVVTGASGSGKTHIAAAIGNRAVELGRPALFMVVPDLLDHLRAAYRPESALPYEALFSQVRDAPVLILDDLGLQNATAWAEEKLFQLINHRFNTRMPTVITTSLRLGELNERLRTRLTDPAVARIFHLEAMESPGQRELGSGSHALLRSMTFRSFSLHRPNVSEEGRATLEKAFNAALSFAEEPRGWLSLIGAHGTGKTHLAAAIANHCQAKGAVPLFFTAADLLDLLRSALADDAAVGYDQLAERIRTAQVVIIDDLVPAEGNAWGREKLYQLLNYRYNAMLPTVLTSGYPLDELDDRLASRMLDPKVGMLCALKVADYRGEIRRTAATEPPPARRRRTSGGT